MAGLGPSPMDHDERTAQFRQRSEKLTETYRNLKAVSAAIGGGHRKVSRALRSAGLGQAAQRHLGLG